MSEPYNSFRTVTVEIQDKFKARISLIVDGVKQGSGSTNDGNTARRFFKDPALSAEITNVDERLIRRFAVILQAIASGAEINIENFTIYTRETAELFVELYGWYNMPASVHKILIHGPEIIENAIVPIGQLSEEAQEARNKDFKRFREHHTRKFSRTATNEDLLNNLLISSDPLISTLRPKQNEKNSKEIFNETKKLLKIYVEGPTEDKDESEEETSEEESSQEETSEEESSEDEPYSEE